MISTKPVGRFGGVSHQRSEMPNAKPRQNPDAPPISKPSGGGGKMCAMRVGTLNSDRNQCDPFSNPPLPQLPPPTRRLYAGNTCASLLSSGAPLAHAVPKQSSLCGSASQPGCIRGGKHGSVCRVEAGQAMGTAGRCSNHNAASNARQAQEAGRGRGIHASPESAGSAEAVPNLRPPVRFAVRLPVSAGDEGTDGTALWIEGSSAMASVPDDPAWAAPSAAAACASAAWAA